MTYDDKPPPYDTAHLEWKIAVAAAEAALLAVKSAQAAQIAYAHTLRNAKAYAAAAEAAEVAIKEALNRLYDAKSDHRLSDYRRSQEIPPEIPPEPSLPRHGSFHA